MAKLKTRVEIVDDTGRRTVSLPVTAAVRTEYYRRHKRHLPPDLKVYLPRDRYGRKLQEKTQTVHIFEDRRLELAIRRAERWMRNAHKRRHGIRGAPKHIALKLAAFHKADPKAFEAAMT